MNRSTFIKSGLYRHALLFLIFISFSAYGQKTVINYVDTLPNKNHPQILYWMWDEHTIRDGQYLRDIDKIAAKSPFDLLLITSRFTDSIGIWNTQRMTPYLKQAVEYAHQKGIKIGLQLWPMNRTRELFLTNYSFDKKDTEALITEGTCILNEKGEGSVLNKSKAARFNKIISANLLKVWLFKETSEGFYNPSSLKEAEIDWLTATQQPDSSMLVHVTAPKKYAGYTVYVTTVHYFNYYDVFSNKHSEVFKKMLDAYSGIPFDGTALDENGAMGVTTSRLKKGEVMTERPWGDDFEAFYRQTYRTDPVRLLLDMRYAPENKPEVRIKAINTYFEARAKGPTLVEHFFYNYSKKLFGKNCFIGCHTTFHNALTGDDIWTTGTNWWDIPREYGQSDEGLPMPDRMGIGMSGVKPVMYNMYYSKDKYAMYKEAINPAPFGVREHYHAWNDSQGWGKNVEDDDFLQDLKPVEERIRLLNHFDPAPPAIPLLIIYNFPYLYNWYPDKDQENALGIRNCDMQGIASSIWNAGYPCASIPSTWLERGMVSVRNDGKVQIKDRVFDAVVFLYPQYAKQTSFAFMKELLDKKGLLMIKGNATADFEGKDCSGLFNSLIKRTFPFDISQLNKIGIFPNPVPNGTFLSDGSVIMANYESIKELKNTPFSIKIGNNTFSGSYQGIFALKVDKNGNIEKLACGAFKSLERNGKTILEIESPADVFFTKKEGKPTLSVFYRRKANST